MKLETDDALTAVGLTDPFAGQKGSALGDHLAAFKRHLAAKGNSPKHITGVVGRLNAVIAG